MATESPSPLKIIASYIRLEPPRFRRAVLATTAVGVAGLLLAVPLLEELSALDAVAVSSALTLLLVGLVVDTVISTKTGFDLELFPSESDASQRQDLFIQQHNPRTVRMCEYSAHHAEALLVSLKRCQGVKSLQLLMCHPAAALNDFQRQSRLMPSIARLPHLLPVKEVDRMGIKIRCYEQPASLRGRNFDDELVAVGWYTYDRRLENMEDEEQIWGGENSLVVAPCSHLHGATLKDMFNEVFDNLWRDAVPLAEAWSACIDQPGFHISPQWLESVSAA